MKGFRKSTGNVEVNWSIPVQVSLMKNWQRMNLSSVRNVINQIFSCMEAYTLAKIKCGFQWFEELHALFSDSPKFSTHLRTNSATKASNLIDSFTQAMLPKQDAVSKDDDLEVDKQDTANGNDDKTAASTQLASSLCVPGVKRPLEIEVVKSDAESEILGPVLSSKVCSWITEKQQVQWC
jgi:hypothetical protein